MSYTKTLYEGYEFVFDKHNYKTNNKITYRNKKIYIPATISDFSIGTKHLATGDIYYFDAYGKEQREHTEFDSWYGTIEGVKTRISPNAIYSQKYHKMTISGEVEWYLENEVMDYFAAGNYAAVKITAPEIYDEYILNHSAKVSINGYTRNWDELPFEKEGISFIYYPYFENMTDDHLIFITWPSGERQRIIIELDETAILKVPPKGTVEGGLTAVDLTYNINDSNTSVIIDGEIKWYDQHEIRDGYDAGYYASIKINAPEDYDATFLNTNTKLTIDGYVHNWVDWQKENDTILVYYPKFTNSIRSHTVKVQWEKGNVQEIVIELADTVLTP